MGAAAFVDSSGTETGPQTLSSSSLEEGEEVGRPRRRFEDEAGVTRSSEGGGLETDSESRRLVTRVRGWREGMEGRVGFVLPFPAPASHSAFPSPPARVKSTL